MEMFKEVSEWTLSALASLDGYLPHSWQSVVFYNDMVNNLFSHALFLQLTLIGKSFRICCLD